VKNGSLFFHGSDVNQLSLDQLRSQIAYVGQEVVLFSDTISANICLGVDNVSIEDIEQCAMDADIHEEIMAFGDGYQTIIGERGVTLSGGQRQRIALARALLCERSILVIDDGLSAVDTSTEATILSALRQRFVGKTVFIVSNRIKLLSMTDQILLLDQGKLLERATHEQLLQTNEFYRTMYMKQMKDSPGVSHA
jgi:ATP-binding cassette subfamily B protein